MAALLDVRPLTPTIGAEVVGVDLATELDDPAVADAIRKAFLDHRVLVVRDQRLDRDQHRAVGRLFDHVAGNPVLRCRVRWEPGTLTIWDHLACQHHAVWDYWPEVREGERVTVAGVGRRSAHPGATR